MKHQKIIPLVCLAAGIIIGAVSVSFAASSSIVPVPIQDKVTEVHTYAMQSACAPQPVAEPETTYQQWNRDSVYTGGMEVCYEGGLYRAKWWTQGETPSHTAEGVWEYLGEIQNKEQPAQVPEATDDDKVLAPKQADSDFRVVAYYPSWKENDLDKLRYDIVTHVNYAFAIPTAEGGLLPLENEALAKKIVAGAHAQGRKALLAIGGWSYHDTPLESTFREATSTEEKRKKFADAIIKMCDTYQFDGIDMDWEHPRVDDSSKTQYESLMLDLSTRLHEKGKLLTAAVLSGATPDGTIYYDAAAHSDAVLKAVDWINVMAYDGGDGDRHSPYSFAVASAEYWNQTRKLPAEKVTLGLPFYARPSWAAYGEILKADPSANLKDNTNFQGMDAFYNGVETIKKKTIYAREKLGGVMIWEITQDTTQKDKSLLTAIASAISGQ